MPFLDLTIHPIFTYLLNIFVNLVRKAAYQSYGSESSATSQRRWVSAGQVRYTWVITLHSCLDRGVYTIVPELGGQGKIAFE